MHLQIDKESRVIQLESFRDNLASIPIFSSGNFTFYAQGISKPCEKPENRSSQGYELQCRASNIIPYSSMNLIFNSEEGELEPLRDRDKGAFLVAVEQGFATKTDLAYAMIKGGKPHTLEMSAQSLESLDQKRKLRQSIEGTIEGQGYVLQYARINFQSARDSLGPFLRVSRKPYDDNKYDFNIIYRPEGKRLLEAEQENALWEWVGCVSDRQEHFAKMKRLAEMKV